MKKKTETNKIKVCSRCKKERPLNDFKYENREAISGKFLWIHPWCNDCRLEVKIKWGTNWIGGTKDGFGRKNKNERENQCKNKTKNTTTVSSASRRRTNKKMHIQRVERTVSGSDVIKHNFSERQTNSMSNKRRSGHVVETLKKTKDYKESI